MTAAEDGDSPIEAAAGAAGPAAVEAFELLAHESRLGILLALWEAEEPFGDDDALAYSDLRRRVGVRDRGRFNYHLRRLDGRFVRSDEGGYRLRNAGRKLVRTVVAGTGLVEPALDRVEIDRSCPYCGAPTSITYEDERLYQCCSECGGTFGARAGGPGGTLTVWPLAPAGVADRMPEEVFAAGARYTVQRWTACLQGVCPECTGAVERSLDVCPDHDPGPDRTCATCGRRYEVQARFVCTVCKNKMWGPPSIVPALRPRVTHRYADLGFDPDADEFDRLNWLLSIIREHDQELVTEEPPVVRVSISAGTDRLGVTIDERLQVREVHR